jgi:ADP-heptose:LPS heptosyltransferase/GT2 family glycosyltransferase
VAILFKEYDLLAQSGIFDAEYYLSTYPEIAALNVDPLLHYVEHGAQEGRGPRPDFDVAYYLEQCESIGERPPNPLLHFITVGARQGLKTHPNGESSTLSALPEAQEADGLLLGIDAVTTDTMSDGSVQLTMRGWALVDEPITEISLWLGEGALAYAAFGLSRPDVAARHPDRRKADHCGYFLMVDALPDGLSGHLDLSLAVQLAGGTRCLRPFSFDMRTSAVTRKSADRETAPTPSSRLPVTATPLRLEVDEIEVNPRGVLEISGWAVCFLDIVAIKIFVGGTCLGPAEYGHLRDDVASACPEYPRARQSGFQFKAPIGHLGAGRTTIKVQAVAQSGATREASFPIVVPEVPRAPVDLQAFHFHCDTASLTTRGRISIEGWAVCAEPLEAIEVRIDDAEAGSAQLDLPRPDVGNIFNQYPHARQAGFSFRQRLDREFTSGEHVLTLMLKDKVGRAREMPLLIQALEAEEASEGAPGFAPASSDGDPERAMWIDSPNIVDGAAATSITSSLSIGGWALARAGVKAIDIAVDGKHLAKAHYGMRRQDVGGRYPGRPEAMMSGFAALIPHWTLPKGQHTVSISVVDHADQSDSVNFSIQVDEVPEGDGPWRIRQKIPQSELNLQTRILQGLQWRPRFCILIKMDYTPEGIRAAKSSLRSLREQGYTDWHALIVVDNRRTTPTSLHKSLFADFEDIVDRVSIFSGRRSTRLAALAARSAAGGAQAGLLSVITAGDVLGCDALMELAVGTGLDRGAGFLYSDERRTSPVTKSIDAYFKPGWSPDLLLSTNYIGRLWTAKAELLELAGGSVNDWLEQGDYDLVLRLTEHARSIKHVAKVLCERAPVHLDSATLERKAIERALHRRGTKAKVKVGCAPGIYQVTRRRATQGLVSIIIPTCAGAGRVRACLRSLKKRTAYQNFEIICIENIPEKKARWKRWLRQNADIVIETFEPFNWSRFNNLCVERASGEFLLFLNDDVEITQSGWLDALLRQAERPEVGAVGPQLLYGDGSVQHAGLILTAVGQARHVFRHARPDDPGYFGLALTERNVIGVTGACLLTRREVFDVVGRFDEAHRIINNDLDYCLKTWRAGYLNVYAPQAQLIHHELASRSELGEEYDSGAFVDEWRDVFLKGDPYLNLNLSLDFDDLSPEREPTKTLCAGHPLMARDAVKRILVLKLDHIGDCMIALPALRRLKALFPQARLSVLSAPATRSIFAMEAVVDETLSFEFFHARSGLGKKEVEEADLLALHRRLAPMRFDLAVDLRKSTDTRGVLKYTGGRYLAGFDHLSECPWLDISLELEGDRRYAAKRQHMADDLLNLVEAVGTSCLAERSILSVDPRTALTLPAADQEEIFAKPVICIHPACGNEMRTWPAEQFAELIDLLTENHDVHAVIVGAPDEMDVADKVLGRLRYRESVYCLVGKLKLAEVPVLIQKCALFIGNNSGPHHIAGALGVPTIGIHSGVVDANEWGPLGDTAVAMQRQMSCSPCYIEKLGDCPKNIACLRGLTPASVYRTASRMLAIRASSVAAMRPAESSKSPKIRARAVNV